MDVDLLGKEGKEAKEEVQQVSQQLKDVESHLNAVDNALQDFMDTSQSLLEKTYQVEEDEIRKLGELDEVEERVREDEQDLDHLEFKFERKIEELQKELKLIKKTQIKNTKKINALLDSELLSTLGRVRKFINTTNKRYYNLRDALESLESRLNTLENDFTMEVNSREFEFDKKLDKRRFEDRDEEIENEIRKLRASVNLLADEMDKKDDIQVE